MLIFFLVGYILFCFGLSKLFAKTDIPALHAWIPGYNLVRWCDLIGKPQWHTVFFLIPIVNFFTYWGMCVDTVRSFGQFKFIHSALAVLFAPIYFIYLGFQKAVKYLGPNLILEEEYNKQVVELRKDGKTAQLNRLVSNSPYTRSKGREWAESVIFAVFAAALIRMFVIEAYVIPTSSMESSLRVGDYLFVSKLHYGVRMPMTLLQIPLLHNVIPLIGGESYISKPSAKYRRLPALTKIKRNDPVVFNWPIGDEIYVAPHRTFNVSQISEAEAKAKGYAYKNRPMDKTDFYIKRCVAIAGDSIEIINRQLYVNGQAAENPENLQFYRTLKFKTSPNYKKIADKLDIYPGDINPQSAGLHCTDKQAAALKAMGIESKYYSPQPQKNELFPNNSSLFPGNTVDNYGPIWIPKEGVTVPLNLDVLPIYERIIEVYENHKLEVRGNKIFIDGEARNDYTFEMNYYWMMGDNRHNSEDSRVWGFVPHTHIVGKPLFIFMSAKNGSLSSGIRWNRVFSGARKLK